MGNNMTCSVVGIGSVKLKMTDGLVYEMQNVRHVSELKKNLISLGMLDKLRCMFKAEKDILKVIKGSMVIMKGSMNNELYVQDGEVITGLVAVSLSINSDRTRL